MYIDIEQAIENLDNYFPELVEALGIQKGRGRNYHCPFHEDKHASASIVRDKSTSSGYKPLFHSFISGETWNAQKLISELEGTSGIESLIRGHELLGIAVPTSTGSEADSEQVPRKPAPRQQFSSRVSLENIQIQIQDVGERHAAYQELQRRLSLDSAHRSNLQSRGLSDEQIEALGFISCGRYQFVGNVNFPGILNGKILASAPGFLCPVRQYGKIIAAQIRTADEANKYRWISNDGDYKIQVAVEVRESPLSFLIGTNPDRPLLSEGFLKTDIIHAFTGETCIGAAGGNWWTGEGQARDYIRRYNPKEFRIFADSDSASNPGVATRTIRQAKEFQSLGVQVAIADYGQLVGKDLPSPDDWLVNLKDSSNWESQINWISISEFENLCQSIGSIELEEERDLKEWILNKALAIFHKPAGKNNLQKFVPPENAVNLNFPEGGRIAAIEAAIAAGKKHILDTSPTGTGKSHTAGEMIALGADHFGVSRILFVTEDPRNITVPGLEDVTRIDSRHRGITLNENGEQRIAKEGEDLISPATCFAPEIFAALRSAGIENADSSSIGCMGCPYFAQCKSPSKFSKNEPNYLYQRRQGLGQPAIVIHPQSLPQPQGLSQDDKKFPYAKAQQGKDLGSLLYWEEFGKLQANQSIIVSQSDIDKTFCQLNFNPIDFFKSSIDSAEFFSPILKKLREIIERDNSRFGIGHQDIVKEFDVQNLRDTFSREQLKEIYDAIAPDLSFLKDSIDSKGLSGSEAFGVRFALTQEKIKQAEQLAKQWLHQFFGVLIGEKLGHFHIAHGQLRIDVYNPRIAQIATEAEINIFSDATLTRDRLAAMLRCKPEDIFVIQQETNRPSNLKIKQIPIKSNLHRGADQTRRIEAAKAEIMARHPNEAIATIGSKKAGDQYYWFNHNRGTNAFYNQGIKHLILDGTPIQNIASLESEYHLLYGRIATPAELQQFTLEKCYTELTQALGRPRANLRPEEITVWAITDIDLSPLGYPIEQVELGSLSLNCLGMVDRLKRKIGEAVKAGAETAQQIAEAVGKTQGRISQIAQQYGGFRPLMQVLKSLLSGLNKGINNLNLPPEALYTLAFEFLGIVGYEDTLLEGIAKAVCFYGQSKFEEAIAALKAVDAGYFEAIVEEIWVELIQITNLNFKIT
jgi:hypothetical protein